MNKGDKNGKKRAIVIGASSGMGREIARLLHERGYRLGIAARRLDRLEALRDELGDKTIEVEKIDVRLDNAAHAFEALVERLRGVDLLVYAAGIGHQNRSLEPEIELSTVETNGLGFARIIGSAFRLMAKQGGGHIAAITSIAGTKGLGPAPAYSATKAFQNVYLQALEQLANRRKLNIRFTDLRPGFVDTDLLNDGNRYPLMMKVEPVAKEIVKAIENKRHVKVINRRWSIITALWRRIPRPLWRHLPL